LEQWVELKQAIILKMEGMLGGVLSPLFLPFLPLPSLLKLLILAF